MRRQTPRLTGQALRDYAASLLAARALSRNELRARLRRRAASHSEVEEVLASLSEYGAVDDARFAAHYAEARAAEGRWGKARVLANLLARRVDSQTASSAVEAAFAGASEESGVQLWLERKFRGQDLRDLLKTKGKFASIYRRLRTAGFSGKAVMGVLKRYAEIEDPFDPADEDAESDVL